jgi:lysophospholipase L1-like esterase
MIVRAVFASILLALLSACGGGSSPISEAKAEPPKPVILAFGDSITAGYMPVDGVHQLRQDLSYLSDLKPLGHVITAAVGGATAEHGRHSQAYWLRAVPADVVVVMFGINDAVYSVPPATAMQHIGAIFEQWPQAKRIVLAEPLWSEQTRASQEALNAMLKVQAAHWGATYIDLYTPSADLKPWCTADRHPCADWHRATGATVAEAVKTSLKGK